MITILNSSKSVKVLKAVNKQPLRLFPGHNLVDMSTDDLEDYARGNAAAKGMIKENLSIVAGDRLTTEEKEKAAKSKAKNDELNKAYKVIKQANEKLSKKEEELSEQGKMIKELMAKIEKLEKKK